MNAPAERSARSVFQDLILDLLGLEALFSTLATMIDHPGLDCDDEVALAHLGKRVAQRLGTVVELASDGKFEEAKL